MLTQLEMQCTSLQQQQQQKKLASFNEVCIWSLSIQIMEKVISREVYFKHRFFSNLTLGVLQQLVIFTES